MDKNTMPVAPEITISETENVPAHSKIFCPKIDSITKVVTKNFLVLGFVVALIIALSFPKPGIKVAELKAGDWRIVQALNSCLVFLISGLTLKYKDFLHLMKKPLSLIIGTLLILFVTPMLSFLVQNIPFHLNDFRTGLAIFCIVPTTLGVGVALTLAASGNQVLSLCLTVSTNLIGTFTVPLLMKLCISESSGLGSIDVKTLCYKLAVTALLPTVVGFLMVAKFAWVSKKVNANKLRLSMFSSFNLHMMVWQTLSAARNILLKQSSASIGEVIGCNLGIHIFLIFSCALISRTFRFPPSDAVAVIIMASQKSAPVAVTVISYVTPDIPRQGLLSLPCIVGQLVQIFVGSFVAKSLLEWVEKLDKFQFR